MRIALFLALALFLMPAALLRAQAPGSAEPLIISISPANPRPYDEIAITPRSNLINLPASQVKITVNGTVIEEGSGSRTAVTTLGGPGTRTTVRVDAVFNGDSYSKEVVISPGDVSLVVEPATLSHPFYEGASLVAPEGRLRIVAMADLRTAPGTRIPPERLSYTWKLGERVLSEQSGIGRSVLEATAAPRYRDAEVSVTVASIDGAVRGAATANVAAASPELLVYRDDPLLGVDFSRALSGTFVMTGEEDSFRAVPFHFLDAPSFAWTLNGSAAGANDRLTVRAEGARGTARIGARASRGTESADASFSVQFGSERAGFFGF